MADISLRIELRQEEICGNWSGYVYVDGARIDDLINERTYFEALDSASLIYRRHKETSPYLGSVNRYAMD